MTYTMETKKLLVSIFAIVALVAVFSANASAAFAQIDRVGVNGINSNQNSLAVGVFAGESIPIRVYLTGIENATDARVSIRFFGESGFSQVSNRFDVIAGSTYSIPMTLRIPSDIDPDEEFILEARVETNTQSSEPEQIRLRVERDSYMLEILSVVASEQVQAGDTLALDVVVTNRGRQLAEDTFVRATIPELGVSTIARLGDLSAEDQGGDDEVERDDTLERRLFLSIPRSAAAGVYTVELEAYNSDSRTTATKRVVIGDSSQDSRVLTSGTSKTFAAGEEQTYSLTIVNTGNEIQVYELTVDAQDISVELEDTFVVVPAGASKTVQMTVSGNSEGTHTFAVSVHSEGQLIERESFTAVIEGRSVTQVNASVVLTVVLAVIFVVLVIVLIVLLTRKPQKTEEFGESYY